MRFATFTTSDDPRERVGVCMPDGTSLIDIAQVSEDAGRFRWGDLVRLIAAAADGLPAWLHTLTSDEVRLSRRSPAPGRTSFASGSTTVNRSQRVNSPERRAPLILCFPSSSPRRQRAWWRTRIPSRATRASPGSSTTRGDVIATGTPSGVGYARKPPGLLEVGDEVAVAIDGIGELRNRIG